MFPWIAGSRLGIFADMRVAWFALAIVPSLIAVAAADPAPRMPAGAVRCDNLSTEDLSVDGLLDDWHGRPLVRLGDRDGSIALRCSWDGKALGLALMFDDDRVVRVPHAGRRAHQDGVDITVGAGRRATRIRVKPGNRLAKPELSAPRRVAIATSLQPRGFSIEARLPARAIAGLGPNTPSLALRVVFHDADRATGGDDDDLVLATKIELSDRSDLLTDFLRTVGLRRSDLRLDRLVDLDPDRRGAERVVAGGTVIGVLTDRYAYVTVPAANAADVLRVELLPFGRRGTKVIAAVIRESGSGGTRDLLMLWTVWSGQLEALGSIEVREQVGAKVLASTWRVVKGRKRSELWVEPEPAVGFTPATWHETPAPSIDPIVLPWDRTKGGIAYFFDGQEIQLSRRDLPVKKLRRKRRR